MKLAVGSNYVLLVEQVWVEYCYQWLATVKQDGAEVYRSELHRIKINAERDGLRWLTMYIGR